MAVLPPLRPARLLAVAGLSLLQLAPPGLAEEPRAWSVAASGRATDNATELLLDAQSIMQAANFATLATHAIGGNASTGSPSDVNLRMVSPKPVPQVVNASSLSVVYIDTNKWSRKYAEIQEAVGIHGSARATMLYYDKSGVGYVSMRGNASMCSDAEAQAQWWDEGWSPFFPQKQNTPFYTVIKFVPDWLEVVGGTRGNIQSGRDDWLPVSLSRRSAEDAWQVVVPASPPSPSPSPPPPPSPSPSPSPGQSWQCQVCAHIYDPGKDGQGLPFEQLPEDWVCPVCGAAKSSFKRTTSASGEDLWVHDHPEELLAV